MECVLTFSYVVLKNERRETAAYSMQTDKLPIEEEIQRGLNGNYGQDTSSRFNKILRPWGAERSYTVAGGMWEMAIQFYLRCNVRADSEVPLVR